MGKAERSDYRGTPGGNIFGHWGGIPLCKATTQLPINEQCHTVVIVSPNHLIPSCKQYEVWYHAITRLSQSIYYLCGQRRFGHNYQINSWTHSLNALQIAAYRLRSRISISSHWIDTRQHRNIIKPLWPIDLRALY